MPIPYDIDNARQHSEAALASIGEFGLAPTPQNFTIWYAYHSNRQPDLVHAVDRLRAAGAAITEDICYNLYQDYFENHDADAIMETGTRIAGAMEQVSTLIGRAGDDTSRYGDALAGISGALTPDASDQDVRAAVNDLVAETTAMQEQNQRFQQRLLESNQEIEELRVNLETARKEAMTDSLTGLMNRRFIDDALDSAARECVADGEPLSLLMLDVDHFKKFNDTYGHQLGDVVLKQVARCLSANTKGQDITGRFGGEEFMIVLPRTDLQGAVAVGNQILTHVAGKQIVLKSSGKSLGKITLSAGAATLAAGEDVAQLLERADTALYAAKQNGRNQVVSEQQLPAQTAAIA